MLWRVWQYRPGYMSTHCDMFVTSGIWVHLVTSLSVWIFVKVIHRHTLINLSLWVLVQVMNLQTVTNLSVWVFQDMSLHTVTCLSLWVPVQVMNLQTVTNLSVRVFQDISLHSHMSATMGADMWTFVQVWICRLSQICQYWYFSHDIFCTLSVRMTTFPGHDSACGYCKIKPQLKLFKFCCEFLCHSPFL